jgi:deoxyribonuclease-4
MHPGSHTGSGEEAGLRRIAEGLDRAHAATEGFRVMTLTEITAGQGTNLGYTFEQLAAIRAMIDHPERVGICFDTCHALAAGYEFRDRESYERMWDEFDRIIGLERLKVFHLNDSQKDVGSHVDRHAHIGHGMLGLDPFRMILNVPRFDGLPGLLETPKSKDLHEDVDNLRTLRSLVE